MFCWIIRTEVSRPVVWGFVLLGLGVRLCLTVAEVPGARGIE